MFIDRIELQTTEFVTDYQGQTQTFTLRMHADLEKGDDPIQCGRVLSEKVLGAALAVREGIMDRSAVEPLNLTVYRPEEPLLSPFTVVSEHCSVESGEGETD